MGRGFVSEIDLLERIRLNIRARRAASSWSVGHAAKRAGMHARHWQKLEAGEVNATLRTLSRIAIVFGVDAAELVAAPSPLPPPAPSAPEEMPLAKRTKRGGKVAGKSKPAKAAPAKGAKRPAKAAPAKGAKRPAKAAPAKAAPAKPDAPGKPRAS